MTTARALWAVLAVQAICAAFFLYDATLDTLGQASAFAEAVEPLVALALALGLTGTAIALRQLKRREAHLARQVQAASSAFSQVVMARFDEWGLTPAERDVALFSIKGLSIAEIATLRNAAEGTVKAQCAAVYRKAGVSGRVQLLSGFVDDLFDAPPLATP